MNEPDISAVVTVFNNGATLNELIDRLVATLKGLNVSFELIFVDDGSSDESLAILQGRAAADTRIRPFALTRNFGGQAAACAACDQVRGLRVVSIDADLEHFPEDLPALLAMLNQGYDLVCGFRDAPRDRALSRQLPSLLLNAYVRRATGTDIKDVGCSMRALDSRLIRDLESEGEARRLLTPLLLRRARRFAQIPVRYQPRHREHGHSLFSLLGIAVDYYMFNARRPFLVSGIVSVLALVSAFPVLFFGALFPALLIMAVGLLGMLVSLVGEYVHRLYQLSQRLPFYQLRDLNGVEAGEQKSCEEALQETRS